MEAGAGVESEELKPRSSGLVSVRVSFWATAVISGSGSGLVSAGGGSALELSSGVSDILGEKEDESY